MVVSTMFLPLMAVLAGALCLLFFALFTGFYFRNRREAMALRDRVAAEALEATGSAPPGVAEPTPGEGSPAVPAAARDRPGAV